MYHDRLQEMYIFYAVDISCSALIAIFYYAILYLLKGIWKNKPINHVV